MSRGRQGRLTALAVLVLILGPGAIAFAVTAVPEVLPSIVDPGTGHLRPLVYGLVLAVNLVGVAVGLYGVARRADRSAVEVWAMVVAFAWLGDVALVGTPTTGSASPTTAAGSWPVVASLDRAGEHPGGHLAAASAAHRRRREPRGPGEPVAGGATIRDHVSAVVSHDMRAPLAGLHGYLELLVDDEGLDAKLVQRMHERSLMLTRRLTLMCEDLLAATTIEHSDLVIAPADLDLSQQLAECANGFPDLDLRIACPRSVHVHADPLRLQQILSNLVRNAQVHGAEPVTVDASSDSQSVTIRVSDAGEGVPESFIPRLFERYSQGARAASGAGIGLSVVHDLVQAHTGTIRYDLTQPAFIVTLPVGAPVGPPPEGRVLTAPQHGHVTA